MAHHHTRHQTSEGTAVTTNIQRQPTKLTASPHSALPIIKAIGVPSRARLARARSCWVNQARITTTTAGRMPPSDIPRTKRLMISCVSVCTSAVLAETIDQAAHLSLIHISEPTRLGMTSYAVFCL